MAAKRENDAQGFPIHDGEDGDNRREQQNERMTKIYEALLRAKELGLERWHLEVLYNETGVVP